MCRETAREIHKEKPGFSNGGEHQLTFLAQGYSVSSNWR